MATVVATTCSVGVGLYEFRKNRREVVKYLSSVDKARVLRCNGSILTLSIVVLKEEMEIQILNNNNSRYLL